MAAHDEVTVVSRTAPIGRFAVVLAATALVLAPVPGAAASVTVDGEGSHGTGPLRLYTQEHAQTNADETVYYWSFVVDCVNPVSPPCPPETPFPPTASASVDVWMESNGCDGLQRSAGDCDGDGTSEEADDHVVDQAV